MFFDPHPNRPWGRPNPTNEDPFGQRGLIPSYSEAGTAPAMYRVIPNDGMARRGCWSPSLVKTSFNNLDWWQQVSDFPSHKECLGGRLKPYPHSSCPHPPFGPSSFPVAVPVLQYIRWSLSSIMVNTKAEIILGTAKGLL